MITIKYDIGVKTLAGWRNVTITAEAELTSAAMARVVRVIAIDGEAPAAGMSRTGARRQEFNGLYVAKQQVGAKKRLSACEVVGVAA